MTSRIRLSSPHLRYVAWLLDVVILGVAATASAHFYLGSWDLVLDPSAIYFQMIIGGGLILSFLSGRIYRSWRVNDLWSVIGTVSLVWLMAMLLLILYLFLTKNSIYLSRIWFLIWGLGSWIGLILLRSIIYASLHWLRKHGYNYKTLLLVGVGPLSQRVVSAVDAAAWSGIRIVGVIEKDRLNEWVEQPEAVQPNEIWICLPMSDEVGIRQVLLTLRHSFSNIRLVPDVFSFRLINHGISYSLGMPMFDLSMSPVTGVTRIFKRLEDLILSTIILLLISPIMILIALLIKITSDGSILFKQKRLGWNGS